MLDVQTDRDLVFYYKDIKVIAVKAVDMIVSKVVISNETTPKGVKLNLKWE